MIESILIQLQEAQKRELIANYRIQRLSNAPRIIVKIQFLDITPRATITKLIKHFQKEYCAYITLDNETVIYVDVDERREINNRDI